MHAVEKICSRIRHSSLLENAGWLWNIVRPVYDALSERTASRGLTRVMNGTDELKISPKLREIPETYEPEVWHQLMQEVKSGDTFVDVGSFVGLYALAVARRVGERGQVVAYEPEVKNYELLLANVRLNGLEDRLRCENKAVAERDGQANFAQGRSTESRLVPGDGAGSTTVVRLDTAFPAQRIDILKIDVEGFEQAVLEGGRQLLSDPERRPRVIYIEVHPFNWHLSGTTSASLLELLSECRYQVCALDGKPVTSITAYGEVVARPSAPTSSSAPAAGHQTS